MKKIGEVLRAAGQISETQLRSALGEQARWGNRIGETLVQLGYLQEPELIRVLSERLGCQGIDLSGREIRPDVIALIPSEVAIKYACLPVVREAGTGNADVLYVAMEDPTNLTALDDVTFRTGCAVKPLLAGPVQLRRAISTCYESV
ncbi:MAG: general secretion pathway protein GspE [bacterium]|nr:general secretion pathway protein GspE [bacterium]